MDNKKIIFFVNSLKFFLSHRINLAETAFNNNFQVIIVACKDIEKVPEKLKNYKFIHLDIRGSGINIINEIKNIYKINLIIDKYNPDISHFITIKSIFYASILNRKFKSRNILLSFTGIGSISSNTRLQTVIFKKIFSIFIKKLLNLKNLKIIFQNKEDFNYVYKLNKFNQNNSYLIKGSGVDLNKFNYRNMQKKKKNEFSFCF